jgi:hypothetical protein
MRGLANTLSSKKTPFSQFVTSLYFWIPSFVHWWFVFLFTFCLFSISHLVYEVCFFCFWKNRHVFFRSTSIDLVLFNL